MSGSSVEILGDSDSVTVTGLANASQGATINGFAHLSTSANIQFEVQDDGDGFASVPGVIGRLTEASVVELTSNDGGLVLNITSNFAEPSVTQIAIDNFGQLTSEGRSLVIENILNGASPEDLPEYAEAMLSMRSSPTQ